MQTRDDRFTEYKAILRRADWTYNYAEGDAYRRGMESYRLAVHAKVEMLRDYPDDSMEILKLWNEYGGSI